MKNYRANVPKQCERALIVVNNIEVDITISEDGITVQALREDGKYSTEIHMDFKE